jgi:hypothetical protein
MDTSASTRGQYKPKPDGVISMVVRSAGLAPCNSSISEGRNPAPIPNPVPRQFGACGDHSAPRLVVDPAKGFVRQTTPDCLSPAAVAN